MKRLSCAAKISAGLVMTNPAHSRGRQVLEVLSRFSWQLPQTLGGFLSAQVCNLIGMAGGVATVEFAHGATVVKTNKPRWGGIAQGSFIIGDGTIEAHPRNALFQHEFGHYLQSQTMGFAYYSRIGIPSILSSGRHIYHPVEQDAQSRAFLYFSVKEPGFYATEAKSDRGWQWQINPIDPTKNHGKLVWDARNAEHIITLKNAWVKPLWYDYAAWLFLPLGGPFWVGLYNSKKYNKRSTLTGFKPCQGV
jgi:hypothetical protein